MAEIDDNYVLDFGPYKGCKIVNAPASYLLDLYDTIQDDCIKYYIEDNREILNNELKNEWKILR